jgi:hypothetical protein
VRPCPYEDDAVGVESIDEEKIAADVALSVVAPLAFEGMIPPFGT